MTERFPLAYSRTGRLSRQARPSSAEAASSRWCATSEPRSSLRPTMKDERGPRVAYGEGAAGRPRLCYSGALFEPAYEYSPDAQTHKELSRQLHRMQV